MRIIPSGISSSIESIRPNSDFKMAFEINIIKDLEEYLKNIIYFAYLDKKDIKELVKEFDRDIKHYDEENSQNQLSILRLHYFSRRRK